MQYMNHEIFQPCKWPLTIDPFPSMSNASCFYTKQLSRGTQRPVNDQLPHGLKKYYHHGLTNLQMATTRLVWNICWAFINASATPIQPPHLAFSKILSFLKTHSELFENWVESILAILGVDGQCFNHYPKFWNKFV